MTPRFTAQQLHSMFLADLGSGYDVVSDISKKPLLVRSGKHPKALYKVYIYNCTNPPGGRTLDEYKIQLIIPEQKRGERGVLDESDGSTILLVGLAVYDTPEDGVWIIWDTNMHREFAYSTNLQVKMGNLYDTITNPVFSLKKPGNGEVIVIADRKHLREAILMRQNSDLERLLEE